MDRARSPSAAGGYGVWTRGQGLQSALLLGRSCVSGPYPSEFTGG